MAQLDVVSLAILLGSLLILAGILSSLLALRFGAPLLLVFLLVGMLAGEGGLGGIKFDDVTTAYTVGSIALALILFDGGLRLRMQAFRSVLAPAALLATVGVVVTAAITAPFAKYMLGIGWTEALLVGAVVGSTDAAAVFFLINSRGLRLRPNVRATLEVESGTNDPFAIFMAIMLVEILLNGSKSWGDLAYALMREISLGCLIGFAGGHLIVLTLNRLQLAQGLHALFVAIGAVLVFALTQTVHGSGFLAVYLAGLIVGNRAIRAHNSVVTFLDAITWLAQIVMFVLLGLLVWPMRLMNSIVAAIIISAALMLIARPVAVFLCLAPFKFRWNEKLFISWVGLRGAVGIFLASIPLLVGLPTAYLYFDIAFVVVLTSLLIQGWTIGVAARRLDVAFARSEARPRRVELDLPGQLEQEIVGYPVPANSPFLRRGLIPSWAQPTLIVRDEKILLPAVAGKVREGDYIYLLAPPEKAQSLDRFFVDMPNLAAADPALLGDFFVPGTTTLGGLSEFYGLPATDSDPAMQLSTYFATNLDRLPRQGDVLMWGEVALVAHKVAGGKLVTVGLRLVEPDPTPPKNLIDRIKAALQRLERRLF
jgi:cell volume regulation protein A